DLCCNCLGLRVGSKWELGCTQPSGRLCHFANTAVVEHGLASWTSYRRSDRLPRPLDRFSRPHYSTTKEMPKSNEACSESLRRGGSNASRHFRRRRYCCFC
ncbi:unnamed protein product, partial [Ectocarpus sp. 12 AP-2014]